MPPKRDLLAMLVLATVGVLCIWLASGCDATEALIEDEHGTVYVCEPGCAASPAEYCWPGSRAELEKLLGASCHAEEFSERLWPTLVGCTYCCGDDCGPGANAHCGAACP